MDMTIDIQLASRSLLLRIGQLGSRLARQRARAKGGRSFWQEIADSIQVHEEGNAVSIGATHVAARIKHFGGRVSAPGRGAGSLHRRALAIPIGIARTNRWDTDAAQMAGYELFRPKGSNILMGKKGRKTERLFALRKAAQIPADPYWLTEEDLQRLVRQAMETEGWFNG